MPAKKQQRRPAPRSRSKATRRPPPPMSPEVENQPGEPVVPPQGAVSVPPPQRQAERPAGFRRPPQRRTAPIAFNYDYLRKDIRNLAILAPAMVVLVLIAFVVASH